jgi:2-hydroxycyclohexanecarboxyl-CoA dehydrogenase
MIDLEGRVLIVIGGASGIGWAAAQEAVALGARVTVADLNPGGGDIVRTLGAAAAFRHCDATDPVSVERVVADTRERLGRVDALFTTVGGAHLGSIDDLDLATWNREITLNLTSAYIACRAVLPVMRAQRRGAIVTTSSGYAYLPGPDRAGYTAAKAGVIAFTRSLAAAVASDGIRVNCLCPGPTDTPRFRAMNGGDEGVERLRQRMPLGTIPQPIDCARMALYLISDAASQITGQVLHVNGGLLMI